MKRTTSKTKITTTATPAAPPMVVTLDARLREVERWREAFNPLRGLSIPRAVNLLDLARRGQVTELQWTYRFIEEADADLLALIERRVGALLEMDWAIVQVEESKRGGDWDQTLADEQTAVLRAAYEGVGNLYEAIEHLAMATFRGFAHAEKVLNADGDLVRLELVDTWNVVRDGLRGAWKYNPGATNAAFDTLPAEHLMEPADFLVREVARPVDRIALLKFVRANLSEKDWDGFLDIYGIPGGVVVMPPNVPPDKEAAYEASARLIAEGGSGALPHGADYKPNDAPRGNVSPFKERLDHLSEKLILAGTGGMLTMLSKPQGIGGGSTDAHQDTFETIARAEARKISEIFQRQVDAAVLAREFPGEATLAYFRIAANEETDATEFVDGVQKLAAAGYQVAETQIRSKSGYEVTRKPDPAAVPPPTPGAPAAKPPKPPVKNRAVPTGPDDPQLGEFLALARLELADGLEADFTTLARAVQTVVDASDAELPAAFAALADRLPELRRRILDADGTAAAYERILGPALADGLAAGADPGKEALA